MVPELVTFLVALTKYLIADKAPSGKIWSVSELRGLSLMVGGPGSCHTVFSVGRQGGEWVPSLLSPLDLV